MLPGKIKRTGAAELWSAQQQAQFRAGLYKTLLPLVGAKQMIEAANTLLKLQRI
jgi:hypothetical protein